MEVEKHRDPPISNRPAEIALERRDIKELSLPRRNVRGRDERQVAAIMASIREFDFCRPILITRTGVIIDGVRVVEAAQRLGVTSIPCIITDHLKSGDVRRLRIALNRLQETGSWDFEELAIEIKELAIEFGNDFNIPGLSTDIIDQFLLDDPAGTALSPALNATPSIAETAVSRLGDIWLQGPHRVGCGDAKDPDFVLAVMAGLTARLCLTDPPFGVKIVGHVTSGPHRDFVEGGSGTTKQQLFELLHDAFRVIEKILCDGGLCMSFIDWRGLPTMLEAANAAGLTLLNLIVWVKSNAGQGSLYRSRHELCPLFKKGHAAHTNNILLGRNGRWRSNAWEYAGASSINSEAREGLANHPTTKPTEMLIDAIFDVSDRGEIIFDPFLGSGSTWVAAHKTGRIFRGCELDPLYVDVALRRWIALTGEQPVLEATGQTFDQVSRERLKQDNGRPPAFVENING